MGFVDYFLIVWDYVKFARDNGIPVGLGRGSAAGSVVSYSLGITDLDPLRYNLLFERFLNPERITMPDIDMDFCFEGRQGGRRLRRPQVRQRPRRTDRHVRYHGGTRRHPRRCACSRSALRRGGRDSQDDSEGSLISRSIKALQMNPGLKSRYDSEENVRYLHRHGKTSRRSAAQHVHARRRSCHLQPAGRRVYTALESSGRLDLRPNTR